MTKFHYTATSKDGIVQTRTSHREYSVAIFGTDHYGKRCRIGFSRDAATAAQSVRKYWLDVEIVPATRVEVRSRAKRIEG